jgi:signal transduction protein with GAF and PtsI domain
MSGERPDCAQLKLDLDMIVVSAGEPEEAVRACFSAIISAMEAERGFMLLYDGTESEWRAFAGKNMNLEKLFIYEAVSQTIITRVADKQKPIITTNAMEYPRFADKLSVLISEIRSVLCVPLIGHGGLFGLVYLDNLFTTNFFAEKDKKYLAECAQKLSEIALCLLPDIRYRPEKKKH